MKKTVLITALVVLLMFVSTNCAYAYDWYHYGVAILFQDATFATTGRVGDDDGHVGASDLWVGTVEAPALGKAYLISDLSLRFLGDTGYKSYTGVLPLQPSPACTLPAGNWTVDFRAGVPYLFRDGVYVQDTTASLTRGHFSIPVRDQFGNPVVGARFAIGGATWGGNDVADYGQVVTDAAGMLTFPMGVQADLAYEFRQISAPNGYLPMQEAYYSVEIGEMGGFVAVPSTSTKLFEHVDVVINKTTGEPPATGGTPATTQGSADLPTTGDDNQPIIWMLLMLVSIVSFAVIIRTKKASDGGDDPEPLH